MCQGVSITALESSWLIYFWWFMTVCCWPACWTDVRKTLSLLYCALCSCEGSHVTMPSLTMVWPVRLLFAGKILRSFRQDLLNQEHNVTAFRICSLPNLPSWNELLLVWRATVGKAWNGLSNLALHVFSSIYFTIHVVLHTQLFSRSQNNVGKGVTLFIKTQPRGLLHTLNINTVTYRDKSGFFSLHQ